MLRYTCVVCLVLYLSGFNTANIAFLCSACLKKEPAHGVHLAVVLTDFTRAFFTFKWHTVSRHKRKCYLIYAHNRGAALREDS